MAEFYTIEAANDSVVLAPRQLRELQALLRDDADLDLGVSLRDRPPELGEQGAIPVALEVISAVAPLGPAFAAVLVHWISRHHGISIKVSRKDNSFQLSGVNAKDAERLIAQLTQASGVGSVDDH